MNTITDNLRARAQEIRARYHGYEGFGDADANFLEQTADDLEKDEEVTKEKYDEERDELKDKIRDLEKMVEDLEEKCFRGER